MTEDLGPRDHPDKDVRDALNRVMSSAPDAWRLVRAGHWGSLRCVDGCCIIAVNGTPKNAGNHARQILRLARQHPRDPTDPRNRQR